MDITDNPALQLPAIAVHFLYVDDPDLCCWVTEDTKCYISNTIWTNVCPLQLTKIKAQLIFNLICLIFILQIPYQVIFLQSDKNVLVVKLACVICNAVFSIISVFQNYDYSTSEWQAKVYCIIQKKCCLNTRYIKPNFNI